MPLPTEKGGEEEKCCGAPSVSLVRCSGVLSHFRFRRDLCSFGSTPANTHSVAYQSIMCITDSRFRVPRFSSGMIPPATKEATLVPPSNASCLCPPRKHLHANVRRLYRPACYQLATEPKHAQSHQAQSYEVGDCSPDRSRRCCTCTGSSQSQQLRQKLQVACSLQTI